MKFLFLFFSIIQPILAVGQGENRCWNTQYSLPEDYSKADAEADFRIANQNEDRDTTFKDARRTFSISAVQQKIRRLECVHLFDSTSIIGLKAKAKLDSLLNIKVLEIEKELLGNWQCAWSGCSGLCLDKGEFESDGTLSKRMVVTRDSIAIFKNETLESRIPYKLCLGYPMIGSDYFSAEVGTACWGLHFSKEAEYWPWRMDPKVSPFLNINLQHRCVCGCPIEVYYRK